MCVRVCVHRRLVCPCVDRVFGVNVLKEGNKFQAASGRSRGCRARRDNPPARKRPLWCRNTANKGVWNWKLLHLKGNLCYLSLNLHHRKIERISSPYSSDPWTDPWVVVRGKSKETICHHQQIMCNNKENIYENSSSLQIVVLMSSMYLVRLLSEWERDPLVRFDTFAFWCACRVLCVVYVCWV